MLTTIEMSCLVFDVIFKNYHRPFIGGKCNRENIEDNLIIEMYQGKHKGMTEDDVEMICDLVDDMIVTYGR